MRSATSKSADHAHAWKPHITAYAPGLFLLLMIGALFLVTAFGLVTLDTGSNDLRDSDGYMRVVRATELASGEVDWFDGWAHRSNAPYGHSMHWTRPMDVAVISTGAPVLLAGSLDSAMYWGGVLASPVLLVAMAFAMAWAARPLVGRATAWLVGLIAAVQPTVIIYSVAGHPDHHTLVMLFVALMLGAVIRLALGTEDRRGIMPILGGVAAAAALWVAVEAIVWIGLAFAIGLISWIASSRPEAATQRRWWTSFAAAVVVFGLIEHGPDLFTAVEYDRMSLPHVVLGLAAAGTWIAITLLAERIDGAPRRAAAGIGAALLFGLGAVALFPDLLGGPVVDVPDELLDRWLATVRELTPTLEVEGVATAIAILLIPVAGLAAAGWLAWKSSDRYRDAWLAVAVFTGVGAVMALTAVRFAVFPQMFGAIGVGCVCGLIIDRAQARPPAARMATIVAVVLLGAGGYLIPIALGTGAESDGEVAGEGFDCATTNVATMAADLVPDGEILMTGIRLGPEILFRSGADVVAAPYHRNIDGNLDTLDTFEGDAASGAAVLDVRGVGYVAWCPGLTLSNDVDLDPDSLAARLSADDPPDYLAAVADGYGDFVLYRVDL